MFPSAQHGPASRYQAVVGVLVASLVAFNLAAPILLVGAGLLVVVGAAVPKTSVDEHSESAARKDDVGSSPKPIDRTAMESVPKTPAMENSPQA
mgnify:CR=1 FL=1